MADFRAQFSAGVSLQPWVDPPLGARPSRLNVRAEQAHKRHVGSLGVQVTVQAIVGGVAAPLDAALGGRLFTSFLAESASFPPPAITSPGGQSSVQRFTPLVAGHYTMRLTREGGGSIFLHVDVT